MIKLMFLKDFRIDFNRASESKEHNICHYWYFLKRLSFKQMSAMCVMMNQ